MSQKTQVLTEPLSRVTRTAAICVPRTATIRDALSLMKQRKAPCLMVCDGTRLVGIFTERDFLLKVAGRAKGEEPIERFMTAAPLTARLEDPLGRAVEVMEGKGLRHLPIVGDDGAPASVVTVGAVIRHLASDFPAAVVNRPPEPHARAAEADGA
jgi:CBS domain-containing protein